MKAVKPPNLSVNARRTPSKNFANRLPFGTRVSGRRWLSRSSLWSIPVGEARGGGLLAVHCKQRTVDFLGLAYPCLALITLQAGLFTINVSGAMKNEKA